MYATERSDGDITLASATRSTGKRNLFALGGEMLRFTTGCDRSGCDTVIVAVERRAPGGTMTEKFPAETVPPRSPIVRVEVVGVAVEPEPPNRPRIWDEPASELADTPGEKPVGCVGRLEHPAALRSTARPAARRSVEKRRMTEPPLEFGRRDAREGRR